MNPECRISNFEWIQVLLRYWIFWIHNSLFDIQFYLGRLLSCSFSVILYLMNPVLKSFFLLLITLAFPLQEMHAGIHRTEVKEYFANGKIKSVTITKVRTPRIIDLFNFYKETKVIRTEFDSISGNKTFHSVRITKVGMGGQHCYEKYSLKITYDENRKRKYYEESKCDKHYLMYKNYVDGKVIFIHIEKKRKRR